MAIDALEPKSIRSDEIDPKAAEVSLNPCYNWDRAIPSFGTMGVLKIGTGNRQDRFVDVRSWSCSILVGIPSPYRTRRD